MKAIDVATGTPINGRNFKLRIEEWMYTVQYHALMRRFYEGETSACESRRTSFRVGIYIETFFIQTVAVDGVLHSDSSTDSIMLENLMITVARSVFLYPITG